jgi:hypothetical protein
MKWLMTLIALPLAAGLAATAAAKPERTVVDLPPNNAKPLSVSQLYALYRDKTWVWSDGGGYFAPNGQFAAWSGNGDAAGYAEGRWWVSGADGRLCFQFTWRTRKGSSVKRDCFDHRALGDVIYQRKEPSGAWYKFKNSPNDVHDQFHALKGGDLISGSVKRLKARM